MITQESLILKTLTKTEYPIHCVPLYIDHGLVPNYPYYYLAMGIIEQTLKDYSMERDDVNNNEKN